MIHSLFNKMKDWKYSKNGVPHPQQCTAYPKSKIFYRHHLCYAATVLVSLQVVQSSTGCRHAPYNLQEKVQISEL